MQNYLSLRDLAELNANPEGRSVQEILDGKLSIGETVWLIEGRTKGQHMSPLLFDPEPSLEIKETSGIILESDPEIQEFSNNNELEALSPSFIPEGSTIPVIRGFIEGSEKVDVSYGVPDSMMQTRPPGDRQFFGVLEVENVPDLKLEAWLEWKENSQVMVLRQIQE